MLLVNKLTEPGGIKKISLYPDIVRVEIRDGKDIVYRLVTSLSEPTNEEIEMAFGTKQEVERETI